MDLRGEGAVEKGGGEGMIIPEFLRPGGGTGTRSELNSLLSLPFFLLVFDGISLSRPHTLLSIFP